MKKIHVVFLRTSSGKKALSFMDQRYLDSLDGSILAMYHEGELVEKISLLKIINNEMFEIPYYEWVKYRFVRVDDEDSERDDE